jgi:hypothetical protein
VDFKEATDRLTERITLADIAEACGSHPNSIDRARLEPGSKSYRNPPPNWQAAVATLARARSRDLLALAELVDSE